MDPKSLTVDTRYLAKKRPLHVGQKSCWCSSKRAAGSTAWRSSDDRGNTSGIDGWGKLLLVLLFSGSFVAFSSRLWAQESAPSVTEDSPAARATETAGQERDQPAPWRPNFGPRTLPGSTQTPEKNSPTQPAANLPGTLTSEPAGTSNLNRAAEVPGDAGTQSSAGASNRTVGFQDRLPEGAPSRPTSPQSTTNSLSRVTSKLDTLPNTAGQIWREYDITPYTSQIPDLDNPQQAVIDWILQETGIEMWFAQPLGILYADRYQLFVYHTPDVHGRIKPLVDRFVHSRGKVQSLKITLVTVGRPNWRSTAYPLMQAIDVHTPGVEAWILSKENAAMLRSQLDRRLDTQIHAEGLLKHHDGQPVELSNRQPVQFLQRIRWLPGQYPGFEPLLTTINEGYTLKINSLSDLDGIGIEASIECDVDQVEKLTPVNVDIPAVPGGTAGRMTIQIPQMVNWRVRERFRWPGDQVLLLSCGVVANPKPSTMNAAISDILRITRSRADALLFIEYRGPDSTAQKPANGPRIGTVPVSPRR